VTSPPAPDPSTPFGEIPDPSFGASSSRSTLGLLELADSPTRSVVRKRRLAALTGSAIWLISHLAVYGIRSDFRQLTAPYVAAQIILPLLVAVISLFAALAHGRLGLGSRIGLICGLALLGPFAFCLLALATPAPDAADLQATSLLGIFVCFDITVAWTTVPLLAAALTLPGAFAAGAIFRSALVGAAVGLFSGATMNLHCPNGAPIHVLMGHGLPVVIATILGALVLGSRTKT